jgi:hypothetical protein
MCYNVLRTSVHFKSTRARVSQLRRLKQYGGSACMHTNVSSIYDFRIRVSFHRLWSKYVGIRVQIQTEVDRAGGRGGFACGAQALAMVRSPTFSSD